MWKQPECSIKKIWEYLFRKASFFDYILTDPWPAIGKSNSRTNQTADCSDPSSNSIPNGVSNKGANDKGSNSISNDLPNRPNSCTDDKTNGKKLVRSDTKKHRLSTEPPY